STSPPPSAGAPERPAAPPAGRPAPGAVEPGKPQGAGRPQAAPAPPAGPPPIEAKVWSLEDGRERATLSGHNGEVVALDFSPDGKVLATTSRAGVVKLWGTAAFKEKATLTGRQGGVDLVVFSADGKTLVGASAV